MKTNLLQRSQDATLSLLPPPGNEGMKRKLRGPLLDSALPFDERVIVEVNESLSSAGTLDTSLSLAKSVDKLFQPNKTTLFYHRKQEFHHPALSSSS